MNFLEKDLETIIWENFERCAERGLDIAQGFYSEGTAYRQMNLAPYGIADLVYIRYLAHSNTYFVQVIELKKGKVDSAAYMQAKRYETAIASALKIANKRIGKNEATIYVGSVLIGNEVETSGDFVFVLNSDMGCLAFTYSYGFDGIHFEAVGKEWRMKDAEASSALNVLATEWMENRQELTAEFKYEQEQADESRRVYLERYGDDSEALLITANGVMLNASLLALPEGGTDGAE